MFLYVVQVSVAITGNEFKKLKSDYCEEFKKKKTNNDTIRTILCDVCVRIEHAQYPKKVNKFLKIFDMLLEQLLNHV